MQYKKRRHKCVKLIPNHRFPVFGTATATTIGLLADRISRQIVVGEQCADSV